MTTAAADDLLAPGAATASTARGTRWTGPVLELLVTISGANRAVLREAPRERVKQASMGAVLLSTAVVAMISAAYAMRVALHLWVPFAVLAGAVWGLIILNLDRWLVISTPRLKSQLAVVGMALPRVALALLIGTVISTPLTLAVFSSEIDTQLKIMEATEESDFTQQLANDTRFKGLPAAKQQITALEADLAAGLAPDAVQKDPRVAALQDQADQTSKALTEAEQAVICEKQGGRGCGGSGVLGAGIAYQEKVDLRDKLRGQLATVQQQLKDTTTRVTAELTAKQKQTAADQSDQLAALRAQVATAELQMRSELTAHQAAVGRGSGILARLEALGQIQKGHPELLLAHVLLFGLMTALECMPIIFKTMLALAPPGLYDDLVRLEEERILVRTKLRQQAEFEEAETLARTAVAAAEARAASTLEAESRATRMVLDAQLAVTEESVRRWTKEQMAPLAPEERTARVPEQTGPAYPGATGSTPA